MSLMFEHPPEQDGKNHLSVLEDLPRLNKPNQRVLASLQYTVKYVKYWAMFNLNNGFNSLSCRLTEETAEDRGMRSDEFRVMALSSGASFVATSAHICSNTTGSLPKPQINSTVSVLNKAYLYKHLKI